MNDFQEVNNTRTEDGTGAQCIRYAVYSRIFRICLYITSYCRLRKYFLIVEETFVVPYEHHGFDLLDRLKHDTDNDDQAGSSKGDRGIEETSENERKDADHGQADRTNENNVIENPVQVLAGGSAGTDTRDKSAALLQIVRDLDRIESDRCVEIRKEDQKDNIEHKSQ